MPRVLRLRKVVSMATRALLLRTLPGHRDAVNAVAVTPDGRCAVSGSDDGTIMVWSLESGEPAMLQSQNAAVTALAVTPDCQRLISGSADGRLDVWDLAKRTSLATLRDAGGAIQALAVMPDGERALSGSERGAIRIWNLRDGGAPAELAGHEDAIMALAVTPDGKRAVSGAADGTIKVWDLESQTELLVLAGHQDAWVTALAVTADGKRALSGSEDRTIKVWELESGTELATMQGHTEAVWALAVTPDGLRVVSGSEDRTLKVWDLLGGDELRTLVEHRASVTALAVTPDGLRVISGSHDHTLNVWDLAPQGEARSDVRDWRNTIYWTYLVYGILGGTVLCAYRESYSYAREDLVRLRTLGASFWIMAITARGRRAVLGSLQGHIEVWDLNAPGKRTRLAAPHHETIMTVAVSADEKRLFLGMDSGLIQIVDLESGHELGTLIGHSDSVTALAVSADGFHAISGAKSGVIYTWDLRENVARAPFVRHRQRIFSVAIAADGKRAVSSAADGAIVWDLESNTVLAEIPLPRIQTKTSFISTDLKRVVWMSIYHQPIVCDLASGDTRTLGNNESTAFAIAVTGDGKRALLSNYGGSTLWDLDRGTRLATHRPSNGTVCAAAVSAGGARGVTGSTGGSLEIWDLRTGKLEAQIELEVPVYLCAITPDERTVIAAGLDGCVYFFALA